MKRNIQISITIPQLKHRYILPTLKNKGFFLEIGCKERVYRSQVYKIENNDEISIIDFSLDWDLPFKYEDGIEIKFFCMTVVGYELLGQEYYCLENATIPSKTVLTLMGHSNQIKLMTLNLKLNQEV